MALCVAAHRLAYQIMYNFDYGKEFYGASQYYENAHFHFDGGKSRQTHEYETKRAL